LGARGGVDETKKALGPARIANLVGILAVLRANVDGRRAGQALVVENVVELLPIVAGEKNVVANERKTIDARPHSPRQGRH
jgi:hypothetical protein